jgi:hypothetical protein
MDSGMKILMAFAITFGLVYFAIKYYDSQNKLISGMATLVGLILILLIFITGDKG